MADLIDKVPSCRVCGTGSEHQNLRADTVFGGREDHNFWHCRNCDAVYLYPPPSLEEEARFYREEFAKFMSSRSGSERDWSNAEAHVQTNQDQIRRRWPFLEPHVRPEMDLLEIGCSSGFMMDAFREHDLNCVGVEPSGEFLSFLAKNKHVAYQSLEELRSKNSKKFDLIVHFFVLEHIRDPFSFLKETYSLLKPQGKIIAENWDAQIIYTTAVQFLETLFGSGTRGVRRMHQLANAVIIFDEIQTLPVRIVHLFNNAINFLIDIIIKTRIAYFD